MKRGNDVTVADANTRYALGIAIRPDKSTITSPRNHSGKPTDSTPSNFWNKTRTIFLSPEGYKKYCEGCQFLVDYERKAKLMVITCRTQKCIYIEQNEIWQNVKKGSNTSQ